jgi:hypothetical protein
MYRLRRPTAALLPFVEHYWFVTHPDNEPVQLRVDVFVDGRADLIVNHGVPYVREVIGKQSRVLGASNLDAQRLVPIRISQRGLVDIAGVRFHLGGLGPFVRSPLSRWTGLTPDLTLIFGPEAHALEMALADTRDLDDKARLLDTFLLDRLDQGDRLPDFTRALAALLASDASVRPAGGSPSEQRDRARLFARYLGIPPQTLWRILRFQRALRALMSDPEGSLSDLASNLGYFDQAHFIREFREMTGGVPRGYRGYYPPDAPADFAPNVVAYVQDGVRSDARD